MNPWWSRLEELAEAYRVAWEAEREAEAKLWEQDDITSTEGKTKQQELIMAHGRAEDAVKTAHLALMKYIRRKRERPKNFNRLSVQEQWEIDKQLGWLDKE